MSRQWRRTIFAGPVLGVALLVAGCGSGKSGGATAPADLVMQEATPRFMTGFREVPEVQGLRRQLGAPGAWWIPGWLRSVLRLGNSHASGCAVR